MLGLRLFCVSEEMDAKRVGAYLGNTLSRMQTYISLYVLGTPARRSTLVMAARRTFRRIRQRDVIR